MDDYEAIRRLLAEYCIGTDTGDTDRWSNCFADDIVFDGPFGTFDSKEAGRAYHLAAGDAPKNFRHVNSNAVIDIDGNDAVVHSYIQVFDQTGGTPVMIFLGFYDDRLVKHDGRWLIRSRKLSS